MSNTQNDRHTAGASRRRQKRKREKALIRIGTFAVLILLLAAIAWGSITLSRRCSGARPAEWTTVETTPPPEETQASPGKKINNTGDMHEGSGHVYTVDGTTYIRTNVLINDEVPYITKDTSYYVRVNLAWDCLTVYSVDEKKNAVPIRAFACSPAEGEYTTPEGEFLLGEWNTWCLLEDGTYGQYAYRIYTVEDESIMFHSVPYTDQDKSTLKYDEYNKLGDDASMGCIRLSVANARWLCENLGTGTLIEIYSDETDPGPLGKPSTFFIPDSIKEIRGWDPTDPDSANPWHNYDFSLELPDTIQVNAGSKPFDITEYVTATDVYGNDLSEYVVYSADNVDFGYGHSDMDLTRRGTYDLIVSLRLGPLSAYRGLHLIVK